MSDRGGGRGLAEEGDSGRSEDQEAQLEARKSAAKPANELEGISSEGGVVEL